MSRSLVTNTQLGGMSGLELSRSLSDVKNVAPIVFLTHDEPALRAPAEASGSLALVFAFGAKARQERQIDEAAREKQSPDEAPD
jgi:hypothetical protein